MQPANVISLRQELQARFPSAHAVPVSPPNQLDTGIACLDALPLIAGSVSELISEQPSCGSTLLLHALLAGSSLSLREPVALVDAADAFDPQQLPASALERLLWVRCRDPIKAIRATDLLLRDGNLPRVLLDLQLCPAAQLRQIPSTAWHRLRMLAEKSGALLCVFTAFQSVPAAASRLHLKQSHVLHHLDQSQQSLLHQLSGEIQQRRTHGYIHRPQLSRLTQAG